MTDPTARATLRAGLQGKIDVEPLGYRLITVVMVDIWSRLPSPLPLLEARFRRRRARRTLRALATIKWRFARALRCKRGEKP